MTDERGKSNEGGGPSKGEVDPCAEYQADGMPCPGPEETCDKCGRGTPRDKNAD